MTHLDNAERLLRAGDVRRARKALERARSRALLARDVVELRRIHELAARIFEVDAGARSKRLVYATTQNLRFLEGEWPQPAGSAPSPSREFRQALAAVDVAARTLEDTLQTALTVAAARAAQPVPVPALVPPPAPARPTPAPPPPPRPARPPKPRREIDWSQFLGARGLAWAGGLVTILGIVFFFVLAANRGWLTPEIRIALGTGTSVTVFCAGLWVKRRYGRLYAALGAVSAGIAGAYATLLAATALYGFVPQIGALFIATAIAAVGVAVSLAWSAQMVAGLGLIGAMLVPLMIVVDEGELSFVGTCFVAIVLAGTTLVAIRKRWRELLLVGAGASLVQIAVLVAQTNALEWRLVGLSAIFWFLYLGTGLAWQLRFARAGLEPVAGTLIITGGALATYASAYLVGGSSRGIHHGGIALLVVSAVYGGLAAFFFGRPRTRDLTSLLWAIATILAAVAVGELFTGPSLTAVWGAVAALLAWLAAGTGERRFLLPAFGYLLLAVGYVLAVEAPPEDLFVASGHPAEGAPSAVFAASALVLVLRYASRIAEPTAEAGSVARYLDVAVTRIRALGPVYAWSAGVLTLYAASLALLELFVQVDTFEHGHVALAGLWAAVAVGLMESGLRLPRADLQLGAFALLVLALGEALLWDLSEFSTTVWSLSFLALGAGALLLGYEFGRLASLRERLYPAGASILLSAALGAAAVVSLVHGEWAGISSEGAALLGLGLVYGGFCAPVFRSQRDLSTLLWSLALALAIAAGAELLSGVWLVLAGALLCAGLSLGARALREVRLQLAAALVFGLSLAYALFAEAPPRDLFVAVAHPGAGVPALLFLAGAAGVFTYGPRVHRHARALALGVAGVLLFYAVSLAILELAEIATNADIDTKFQRGHSGVSAFWGLVSLAFLYFGLTRRSRALRLAGFALFGVTLGKIFLYDLAFLSSLTRALSFIAVGGVLLLAGFFYQRISEELEDRDRSESPGAPSPNIIGETRSGSS
jgi:uncharacterized membrane protein